MFTHRFSILNFRATKSERQMRFCFKCFLAQLAENRNYNIHFLFKKAVRFYDKVLLTCCVDVTSQVHRP